MVSVAQERSQRRMVGHVVWGRSCSWGIVVVYGCRCQRWFGVGTVSPVMRLGEGGGVK